MPKDGSVLAGHRALITGGSSGIGVATARLLDERGVTVALLGRSPERLRAAADSCNGYPVLVSGDVGDRGSLQQAVGSAAAQLGGDLDLLVVNAASTAFGPFDGMSERDFRRTFEVTFIGAVDTIRIALPLLQAGAGRIVVVSSIAGSVPIPLLSPYVAAKHALEGTVRALQIELRARRSPISISLVAPGPVATPFWRRMALSGARRRPQPPLPYDAAVAARAIVECLERPRRRLTVGGATTAVKALAAVPPVYDRLAAIAARRYMGPTPIDGRLGMLHDPNDATDDIGIGDHGRRSLMVRIRRRAATPR